MTKAVLDVGNCDPDHNAIKRMLTKEYDVEVLRCHHWQDTAKVLGERAVDLILINRKLDVDYSDGMEILKELKKSAAFRDIPVMIITNYPEHQDAAIAAGAEPGFGKLQFSEPETHRRLSRILQKRTQDEPKI